ncbi:MAG TPA: FtsX-like permease family protein [Solirubrobacteraceae bacterium]|nr:FtsX-like permease family protein [Solirubrobacteraceae bacterium]
MSRFESVAARPFMGISGLLFFYRERLRQQAVEELLAGFGIAVAVALLFAVTVASQSVASSAEEVNRALVGPANLQLRARGPEGLSEALLGRVEALKGVAHAAPLLEENATIRAGSGASVSVNLAGADVSVAALDGLIHTLPIATLEGGGVGLSRASAEALGLARTHGDLPDPAVSLALRGQTTQLRVNAVLGPESFGALSQARVAVMPLERLQALAGLHGRLSRILVQSAPGAEIRARSELERLAAGRLTVAPANQDVQLLHEALHPSEQASLFFAAISALLGFLLTFNAYLLTVPERRRAIADLRLRGVRSTAIMQMVLFQAFCLGVIATVVGLLVGYGLSVDVFAQKPSYLTNGFTLGTSTVVGTTPLLVAGVGGVLATCLASGVLLLDLRRGRAANAMYLEDGEPGNALGSRPAITLAVIAGALVIIRAEANSLWPSLALAWSAMLALAAVLCVPLLFACVLGLGEGLVQRFHARLRLLPLALESLRETTLRALALVATGAAALFGAVALGGARDDLLRGIGGFATHYAREGDIWVFTPHDNQAVLAFPPQRQQQLIARLPGVRTITTASGGLFDVGTRRVWLLAWPSNSPLSFLDGQIIDGQHSTVLARLRSGDWATVSQQLAGEHHVGVGDQITLPTPSGAVAFRIAALTTNFGWSPGAIVLGSAEYARAWQTTQATALAVGLQPGADPERVRREVARALGSHNGLEVLLASSREANMIGSAHEGLSQLGTISTLLVLASILAMAAALASAIWQRRRSLAVLRLSGVRSSRLRSLLLLESSLMLGVGAVAGAGWGLYGQVALDGYLTSTTGFPVERLGASLRPLEVLVVVFVVSLAVAAIPAWLTSRVSPRVALEE